MTMDLKRQSASLKRIGERIRELQDDTVERVLLDPELFPAVTARFDPPDALNMLRSSFGPVVSPAFSEDLRAHVAWLYNALSAADAASLEHLGDHDRLRASTCEAIAHIEQWAERHGRDACGTAFEDAAARRGWPDETGRGWMPPWDLLAIDRPCYWASDSSE